MEIRKARNLHQLEYTYSEGARENEPYTMISLYLRIKIMTLFSISILDDKLSVWGIVLIIIIPPIFISRCTHLQQLVAKLACETAGLYWRAVTTSLRGSPSPLGPLQGRMVHTAQRSCAHLQSSHQKLIKKDPNQKYA